MAGETYLTVVGNLTADPQYRVLGEKNTPNVTFSIASTPRQFDRNSGDWKDQDTVFFNCVSWSNLADNISKSLKKGMRVIARGSLEPNNYTNKDGVNVRDFRLRVIEIGPSLAYQTADVSRGMSQNDSVMPNSFQNNFSNNSAPASPANAQAPAEPTTAVNITTPSSADESPWSQQTNAAQSKEADSKPSTSADSKIADEDILSTDGGNPFL